MKNLLVLLVLFTGLSLAGCAPKERRCDGSPSTAVVAWLSKARALHHTADLSEDQGDVDRAVALLDELAKGPRPPGVEIDEVMADTHARLAELRTRKDDFEGAIEDTRAGLDLAQGTTYFRGHLYEVLGLVLERRAKDAARRGDDGAAAALRREAVAASLYAVRIQDDVIRRTLRDAGGPTTRDR
jgi:hypothetical protein